jgi:hypothetical protein
MAEAAIAENRPEYRRRKILLRPGYQLRVAATILVFIVGYSLLLGFLIFYPLQQEFAIAANPDTQFWIARQVLELHKRFWPSVLVVGILVAVQSVFVTHRIVGPAYHIQRIMEGFTGGKYDMRAHLRRGDRLKELETAVNTLGDALHQRETARHERVAHLREAAAALQSEASGVTLPPRVQEKLGELGRIVANLSEKD